MNAKQFILITGGSGFYGRNLVKKLSKKKIKIILLEKNKNFFLKRNRNIKQFYFDVSSKNDLESLTQVINNNGIILCDDYDLSYAPGVKKAIDKYVFEKKFNLKILHSKFAEIRK